MKNRKILILITVVAGIICGLAAALDQHDSMMAIFIPSGFIAVVSFLGLIVSLVIGSLREQ